MLNAVSLDSQIRAFLWPELVQKVVFFLITEAFETIFEVLFNDIAANLEFLFRVKVFLLLGDIQLAFKAPESEVS